MPREDTRAGAGSFRLATPGLKLMYIVASVIVVVVFAVVIGRAIDATVKSVILDVVIVIVWAFGIRSFRGPGEDLLAPRAWWRATTRPGMGYVVAAILIGLGVLGIVDLALGRASLTHLVVENSAGLPIYIFGAAVYLNSSVRLSLHSRNRPVRPREVRPAQT